MRPNHRLSRLTKSCAAAALIGAALGAPSLWADEAPLFQKVPVAAHVYDGGWEHFVGGGVAAFDCDGDLRPELYVAGGSNPAVLLRNHTGAAARAAGEGAALFIPQTPKALALKGVTGAYPLDIDGDGLLDLAVLRVGPDQLLRGRPGCRFEPFEDALGFTSADHWSTAFSATWERGARLPTLAFGTYVDRRDPSGPFEACDATLLYRPDGARYGPPQELRPGYCALSMLFSDWAREGRADLRISNDRHYYVRGGQEQMWRMDDQPRLYRADEGWRHYALWGMGIASRDMNGDGYPDLYLTSMGDQKFQLFDLEGGGGPSWQDATYARGTSAHRPHTGGDGRPSTGWHAAFGDVNNDGRDDIFVAKGNVEQMPDAAMDDPNSLLMQGADGNFTERAQAAGLGSMVRGRGAALVDLDLDGRLDVAVVNRRAPMELFMNAAPATGHWLLLGLTQPSPNTQAIGGFIELRAGGKLYTREITVGGGHVSGVSGLHHFGLGEATQAEFRVIWPGGEASAWRVVSADQIVQVKRP